MGRLMGDHIVRETGEDRPSWEALPGGFGRGGEVAEEERALVGAVEGVGLPQRVRVDAQPTHVLLIRRACSSTSTGLTGSVSCAIVVLNKVVIGHVPTWPILVAQLGLPQ